MIYENKHVTSNFQKLHIYTKKRIEKGKNETTHDTSEWDNLNAVLITIIIGDRILI